jgi:hypothetical protein
MYPSQSLSTPSHFYSSDLQQSLKHVVRFSFNEGHGEQYPSPQYPQSTGQFRKSSPPSHAQFPQNAPQSAEHEFTSSPGSHTPFPHAYFPQSEGQFVGFSPFSHIEFPHAVAPQSRAQLSAFSVQFG